MAEAFRFGGHKATLETGEVEFYFTLVHSGTETQFTEKIAFAPAHALPPSELVEVVLQNIALALGITYWKLTCPANIDLGPYTMAEGEAAFWETIYTKGLGEFQYRNNLNLSKIVHFARTAKKSSPIAYVRQARSLLFVGGGRDSIVAGELLKACNQPFEAFVMNPEHLQREVAGLMGVSLRTIKRTIDPQFFEINLREGMYRGHVPISLVYALLGLLEAILADYRYLVVANEASSDYGNVEYNGEIVNHQWSKSTEFEALFRRFVHDYITHDVSYFSLLRPLTEIRITEIFSRYPQYFSTFSSCNTNFKLIKSVGAPLWCGQCPKCAFVFAMLAAYLPKKDVVAIFGKDLFADATLLPLYEELLGLRNFKPFECVGTPEEMRAALNMASTRKEFAEAPVMSLLERKYTAKEVLLHKEATTMPEGFKACIANI